MDDRGGSSQRLVTGLGKGQLVVSGWASVSNDIRRAARRDRANQSGRDPLGEKSALAHQGAGEALLSHLGVDIAAFSYAAVFALVALEYMALPLPGETALVAAAVLAGQGRLDISAVVFTGAAAAILGGLVGYWIGRRYGLPMAQRYGSYVGIDAGRLKIGQYLFWRHGGKIIFFGRFVALLRALSAFLAGVNHFDRGRFFVFNALGGLVWAAIFGLGGYGLGVAFETYARPVGLAALGVALLGFLLAGRFIARQEPALRAQAEAALPGPLGEARPTPGAGEAPGDRMPRPRRDGR